MSGSTVNASEVDLFFVCYHFQLIFEKEGVYLHTNAKRSNQETTIPGFIRIVERVSRSVLDQSALMQRQIVKLLLLNNLYLFIFRLEFQLQSGVHWKMKVAVLLLFSTPERFADIDVRVDMYTERKEQICSFFIFLSLGSSYRTQVSNSRPMCHIWPLQLIWSNKDNGPKILMKPFVNKLLIQF